MQALLKVEAYLRLRDCVQDGTRIGITAEEFQGFECPSVMGNNPDTLLHLFEGGFQRLSEIECQQMRVSADKTANAIGQIQGGWPKWLAAMIHQVDSLIRLARMIKPSLGKRTQNRIVLLLCLGEPFSKSGSLI